MNRDQIVAELNKANERYDALATAETRDNAALADVAEEIVSFQTRLSGFDAIATPAPIVVRDEKPINHDAVLVKSWAERAAAGENLSVTLEGRDIFTGVSAGGQDIVPIDYIEEIDHKPRRPLTLLNYIPVRPTTSDTISVFVETLWTNAAAPVKRRDGNPADYVAYQASDIQVVKQLVPVVKIGSYVRTDRDSLADQGQLQMLLSDDLQYFVTHEILNELVATSDTTNGLHSIAVTGPGRAQAQTYTLAGDDDADRIALIEAIRKAKTATEKALLPAEWVALSPAAYEALQLAKSSTGFYLSGGPFGDPNQNTIWGLNMVICHELADNDTTPFGRVLVGTAQKVTLFSRRQTELTVSENVNDDFLKDAVRIKASVRLALSNRRPEAIVVVTGVVAPPA